MYTLQLRAIRKKRGLTQADLAASVGVSERVLGAWEREETAITLEDAARCAVALGCTPNDLCGWQEQGASCGRPLTAEESRLVDSFRECTRRERSAILNMADTMADGGAAKNDGLREGREAV